MCTVHCQVNGGIHRIFGRSPPNSLSQTYIKIECTAAELNLSQDIFYKAKTLGGCWMAHFSQASHCAASPRIGSRRCQCCLCPVGWRASDSSVDMRQPHMEGLPPTPHSANSAVVRGVKISWEHVFWMSSLSRIGWGGGLGSRWLSIPIWGWELEMLSPKSTKLIKKESLLNTRLLIHAKCQRLAKPKCDTITPPTVFYNFSSVRFQLVQTVLCAIKYIFTKNPKCPNTSCWFVGHQVRKISFST